MRSLFKEEFFKKLQQGKAILKDEIIERELSFNDKIDLEYKKSKLLDARKNNSDFELQLVEMICGRIRRRIGKIKGLFSKTGSIQ